MLEQFISFVLSVAGNFTYDRLKKLLSRPSEKPNKAVSKSEKSLTVEEKNRSEQKPILSESNSEEMAHHREIDELLDRVLLIYAKHGISTAQIPRVTPHEHGLTLDVLRNRDRTLTKLTPEYLAWLATTFGVCLKWIEEGGDNRLYPLSNYYKNVHELLRWLFERRELQAWAFKDVQNLDKSIPHHGDGAGVVQLLFAEPIFTINSRIIYRYHIDCTQWDWNYWRSRYQLKSIVKICEQRRLYFSGYTLPRQTMIDLSCGQLFPLNITKTLRAMDWHIDDYVDTPQESACAEDTDETQEIFEYMKRNGYWEYLNKDREY